MTTIDQIRDLRRIYSIHGVLGIGANVRWMSCPLPMHRRSGEKRSTPSFSIYFDKDGVQRFKCHGNCGKRGDVIDLVGYLNIGACRRVKGDRKHDIIAFFGTLGRTDK